MTAPTPSYDIIDSAGYGYRFVWQERSYLLKLAAVPLIVKLICFEIMVLMGWQEDFITRALVMLPSYFTDGWMITHVVRLIYLGQRWPWRPTGDDQKDRASLSERMAAISKGTLVFVTIKFFLGGYLAVLESNSDKINAHIQAETAHIGMYIVVITAFVVSVWGFRFLWLFIPAALNYSIRSFIFAISGFRSSFSFIGAWFICVVPPLFAFTLLSSLLLGSFEGSLSTLPVAIGFMVAALHVFFDMLVTLLTAAAIAHLVMGMVGFSKKESS